MLTHSILTNYDVYNTAVNNEKKHCPNTDKRYLLQSKRLSGSFGGGFKG